MPTIALTDSKTGQILANVCTALRAMTIAGGYHWDVASTSVTTDVVNIVGVPSAARPFFMVEPSATGAREFQSGMRLYEFFRVQITAVADAVGTSADRKFAATRALLQDIEKALLVDLTRGGLAIDTRLQTPEEIVGVGAGKADPDGTLRSSVFVVQELECKYIRPYGQP